MQTPPSDWFAAGAAGYKPPGRPKRDGARAAAAAQGDNLPTYQALLAEFDRRMTAAPPSAPAPAPANGSAAGVFAEFEKRTGQKM